MIAILPTSRQFFHRKHKKFYKKIAPLLQGLFQPYLLFPHPQVQPAPHKQKTKIKHVHHAPPPKHHHDYVDYDYGHYHPHPLELDHHHHVPCCFGDDYHHFDGYHHFGDHNYYDGFEEKLEYGDFNGNSFCC